MSRLFFRRFCQFSNSVINTEYANSSSKLDRLISHVYRKTWNKKQLIEYLKDNVVFESEKYIVTSLPQGVPLKKTSQWLDTASPFVSEADLNEILKELHIYFNTNTPLHLCIYPGSNFSGLTVFANSFNNKVYLKNIINHSETKDDYKFTFLAVVLGSPPQSFTDTFQVRSENVEGQYCTQISKIEESFKNIRKVHYRHKVLSSSPFASLIKAEVSQNIRGCVRHILGAQFLTPVLGDIWYCVKSKSSFFGNPLVMDPATVDINSLSLDSELLEKLNLKPGDEKLIPVHIHFHSFSCEMKNKMQFFASVPPPENFVWTCNQLGFEAIKNYQMGE